MSIDIKTHSEAETIALGAFLGPLLTDGSVLALRGDLGAGKTHFVQGIAKGMGIDDVVVSPTFTLPDDAATVTIEKMSPTERLFHFDFSGSRWQSIENEVQKYALSH